MWRVRDFGDGDPSTEKLPFLMSILWRYPQQDRDGLPTEAQYEIIEAFESRTLDALELGEELLVAWVETGGGAVEYLAYVSDPQEAANQISTLSQGALEFEFSARSDPDWTAFRDMRNRLS